MSADYYSRLGSKVLYIGYDNIFWKISSDLFEQILDLQSDDEEADTSCLLQAKHAANEDLTSVMIIQQIW